MTAKNCFFSPSQNGLIDTITDEPTPRGHYGGRTLEETRKEYKDAEIAANVGMTIRLYVEAMCARDVQNSYTLTKAIKTVKKNQRIIYGHKTKYWHIVESDYRDYNRAMTKAQATKHLEDLHI